MGQARVALPPAAEVYAVSVELDCSGEMPPAWLLMMANLARAHKVCHMQKYTYSA